MSTTLDLKKKLIGKINQTDNNELLEEMIRIIENQEFDNIIYQLSAEQTIAVEEAQKQYKNGEFISGKQADKEVDEWLDK